MGNILVAKTDCPPRPASDAEATALASEWFSAGSRFIERSDFENGSDAYLCSYAIIPHPASLLNAALAAQKATNKYLACQLFEKYLGLPGEADKKEKVTSAMNELDCSTIMAVPPDSSAFVEEATVFITENSKADTASPDETLPNSEHTADAESHHPQNEPISSSVKPTGEKEPSATLPVVSATVPDQQTIRITGSLLLTTGGIGIATATVLQILAGSAEKKGQQTSDPDLFSSYQQDTERFQTGAFAAYVSGGILFISGITLLLVSKHRTKQIRSSNSSSNPSHRAIHLSVSGFGVGATF
ncbi:MAG: hypothetical protein JXX29_22640 [Deltaproteobacteria bacterium]|nr:hypothetical protein [Deltaproteobacteria bacterium]MBN2674496.1 hypothetical protein [Deltaproteobacteria bacterium]